MIPRVKFSVIPLDSMLKGLQDFLSVNHPWSKALLHEYPELERALERATNPKKRKAVIDEYFRREDRKSVV